MTTPNPQAEGSPRWTAIYDKGTGLTLIYEPDGKTVLDDGYGDPITLSEDRAKQIADALNAHDAMQEALAWIVNDAAYKAPEQHNWLSTRYAQCAARALLPEKKEAPK